MTIGQLSSYISCCISTECGESGAINIFLDDRYINVYMKGGNQ